MYKLTYTMLDIKDGKIGHRTHYRNRTAYAKSVASEEDEKKIYEQLSIYSSKHIVILEVEEIEGILIH